jgi:site-specific DNA-adenine methylase
LEIVEGCHVIIFELVRGSGVAICQISDYFPDINRCKGYIEPFLGAGHTFFYLMANYDSLEEKPIYLSDLNISNSRMG